jgi:hypothetical protein
MNRGEPLKVKGPLATTGNVNSVNRRADVIIVLAIVIIILLFFLIWPWVVGRNTTNSIEGDLCPSTTSVLCTDFNPCTLDLITPICGNITNNGGGTSCQSFQCQNIPLANGSCCNGEDVCYFDDPNKACVFGTCKSPDPTLCKGYCIGNDSSNCPPLPFNINANLTTLVPPVTSCLYSSCVTLFQFHSPIADPNSLLDKSDSTNITNLDIEACLEATCNSQLDELNPPPPFITSFCVFKWKCAPYINVEVFEKKRYINDEREGEDEKNLIQLPIQGVTDYKFYKKINKELNRIRLNMINDEQYRHIYNNNNYTNTNRKSFKFNSKNYKFPFQSVVSVN